MSLTTIDFARLNLKPGDRVLDLGAGEGRHAISAYLEAGVDVVGLDLSHTDLTVAQQRFGEFDLHDAGRSVSFVQASGLGLPFGPATFDVVICAEVLEHVPEFEAVLREIDRVLVPGGVFAVSVPRFMPEWICWRLSSAYHEVEGGHVRIFRTRQLRQAIERLPLRFTARHWAHALHSPYWWLKCLFWDSEREAWPVRTYHRLLVWDLMHKPWLTRLLDRLLNPVMGKSLVMYFSREQAASHPADAQHAGGSP